MKTLTPKEAKEQLENLLVYLGESDEAIHISDKEGKVDAILVNKEEWDRIQETVRHAQTAIEKNVAEKPEEDVDPEEDMEKIKADWTDL